MSRRRAPRRENTDGESTSMARLRGADFRTDPDTGRMAEVRYLQPYQALKEYICPGCNQQIKPGTGHLVVVPLDDPGGRRHWHRPCFERRSGRP